MVAPFPDTRVGFHDLSAANVCATERPTCSASLDFQQTDPQGSDKISFQYSNAHDPFLQERNCPGSILQPTSDNESRNIRPGRSGQTIGTKPRKEESRKGK